MLMQSKINEYHRWIWWHIVRGKSHKPHHCISLDQMELEPGRWQRASTITTTFERWDTAGVSYNSKVPSVLCYATVAGWPWPKHTKTLNESKVVFKHQLLCNLYKCWAVEKLIHFWQAIDGFFWCTWWHFGPTHRKGSVESVIPTNSLQGEDSRVWSYHWPSELVQGGGGVESSLVYHDLSCHYPLCVFFAWLVG